MHTANSSSPIVIRTTTFVGDVVKALDGTYVVQVGHTSLDIVVQLGHTSLDSVVQLGHTSLDSVVQMGHTTQTVLCRWDIMHTKTLLCRWGIPSQTAHITHLCSLHSFGHRWCINSNHLAGGKLLAGHDEDYLRQHFTTCHTTSIVFHIVCCLTSF